MPSTIQSGVGSPGREHFPDHKARIGEDPARWLDQSLGESRTDDTDTTNRRMVFDRIKGIDYLGVINAWIQIERLLDRGPRDDVMAELIARRDQLLDQGDRDDRTTRRPPVEPTESVAVWVDRDRGARKGSASAKIAKMAAGGR